MQADMVQPLVLLQDWGMNHLTDVLTIREMLDATHH